MTTAQDRVNAAVKEACEWLRSLRQDRAGPDVASELEAALAELQTPPADPEPDPEGDPDETVREVG